MPLDPSISLSAQPVQIQPLDLTKTLLSVAQLRNLLSEADLRQLQTAQLGETMRQYQGMTAAGGLWDQLRDTYQPSAPQPAAANVPQLWRNAPAPPASQADMVAPGAGGETYPHLSPTRAMDQLSPGAQAPAGTTFTRVPNAMQAPAMQPVQAQVLESGAPEPQTRPAPGAQQPQLAGASGMDSEAQLAHRKQILQELRFRYPMVAGPAIKSFLDIDTQILTQHKTQLDLQAHMMNGMYQLMASVQAQPEAQRPAAYQQALQAAATLYGQKAIAQLSPTYDAQQVEFYATNARDETKRIEQAQKAHELRTNRMKELREGQEQMYVPGIPGGFAQKYLPTGTPAEPAGGTEGTPATPAATGPKQGLGVLTPPTTANGHPIVSPEQVTAEGTMATAFTEQTKEYRALHGAYQQILAAQHPSDPAQQAASDVALVSGYAQMVHPQGNIRSGVPMTLEQIRGLPGWWQSLYEKVSQNQALTNPERQSLLDQAHKLMPTPTAEYEQKLAQFRDRASKSGLRPDLAAPDFRVPATTPQGGQPGSTARLSPADHTKLIEETGARLGMSPETIALYKAITFAGERSNGDPLARNVGAGGVVATGLSQVTADTAKPYGYSAKDLEHPTLNTEAGLKIVQGLMQKYPGRPDLVAAEYNAGPKPVADAGNAVPNYPKTQEYVQRTLAHLKSQQQGQTAPPAPGTPQAPPPPTARSTPKEIAAYNRWKAAYVQSLQEERQRLVTGGGG